LPPKIYQPTTTKTKEQMSELPTSLAGWQALADDERTLPGDVLVSDGLPFDFVGHHLNATTARRLRDIYGANVYRRIPVAN
jgi:hypothetical protein